MPITTTLNRIRSHSPCARGWTKLLNGLGKTAADNEPLAYSKILEINGIEDALWCCRAEPQHAKEWRLFAVWCARQVQHLMKDQRSVAAIDIAEKYANGLATYEELNAARDDARGSESVAAEDTARDGARGSESVAAEDTVRDDASVAAWFACIDCIAAKSDAESDAIAAEDTVRAAQYEKFKEIVS